MKIFWFIILLLVHFSCSVGNAETLESPQQVLSYYDKIFTNSDPFFNGNNLGDNLPQDYIKTDSLSNTDYFTLSVLTSEEKIKEIKVEIYIASEEKRTLLIEKIVAKYNVHLNQNKLVSKYITWTYTTENNFPAEICMIYEKEFNTISLSIGYKAQR